MLKYKSIAVSNNQMFLFHGFPACKNIRYIDIFHFPLPAQHRTVKDSEHLTTTKAEYYSQDLLETKTE